MAVMLPPVPDDFHGSDAEKEIFRSLRKLPDDVVVIHSLRWVHSGRRSTNVRKPQGEGDFVVIHPKFGVLVIEVKGGEIRCEDGQWYQKNRRTGYEDRTWPEAQASRTKFRILEEFDLRDSSLKDVLVCHAVWFPDVEVADRQQLPLNYHSAMTLDSTHLARPDDAVEKAFNYWKAEIRYTKPPVERTSRIKAILCPTFSIVRSVRQTMDEREQAMIQLTQEQARVVEFLDDQREAAIVGPAGTGKTLLAVEKARRLARPTEQVLFLCFNSALREHLNDNHAQSNVSYRNFHGLAKELGGASSSLDEAVRNLLEYLCDGTDLPYTHLVIDEAQDFEQDWLDLLRDQFAKKGAFYVFYDALQAIQNEKDSAWLNSLPCRLALSKNCRNTNQIAKLAYRSVGLTATTNQTIDGPKPRLHPVEDQSQANERLAHLLHEAFETEKVPAHQVAVLTLATLETTAFEVAGKSLQTAEVPTENKITFNTARRFKGLEAKVVVVVDVDFENAKDEGWRRLLYVACSRARHQVHVITTTPEAGLANAVEHFAGTNKRKSSWKQIARLLGVTIGESKNA